MIDPEVFKVEWEVLAERFRKDHSQAIAARYYQSLSARMDTGEFRAACRVIFDRDGYFPAPEEFLSCLSKPGRSEAFDQWELCERVMRGDPDAYGLMNDEGKRCVRLLSGAKNLRAGLESDLQWRRKEFFDFYEGVDEFARRERAQLAPWTPEGKALLAGLMNGRKALPLPDKP